MCTLAYYNSAVTTRTAMRDVPPCPCADKRALVAGAAVIWGSTTNTQIRELRSLLIAVQGIVFASALVPKYRPRTATSHGGGSRHSFNFHNIANRGPAPGPRRYGGSGVRRTESRRRRATHRNFSCESCMIYRTFIKLISTLTSPTCQRWPKTDAPPIQAYHTVCGEHRPLQAREAAAGPRRGRPAILGRPAAPPAPPHARSCTSRRPPLATCFM